MAKKKSTAKKPTKKEEPKLDLGVLSAKDLNEGSTVTISNERYIVLKDGKVKNKTTGEVLSY